MLTPQPVSEQLLCSLSSAGAAAVNAEVARREMTRAIRRILVRLDYWCLVSTEGTVFPI